MKRKTKEKVGLKQETKSEIQELFDELFVSELNKKITDVSTQTTGSIDALDAIKKQANANSVVICDKIDALKEALQCVGTVDDWGEETLVSFLNQLAQLLVECKREVDKHTDFFGDREEDVPLFELMKNLKAQMEKLHMFIQGLENQIISVEFDKVFKEFKRIDSIVNSLQSIDESLKVVKAAFNEDGLMSELSTTQKTISDDLSAHREIIDIKLDSMETSVDLLSSILSDNVESRNTDLLALNNALSMNNEVILEKIDSILLKGKQRFTYVTVGMGILVLSNIVMFVMLLMK